MNSMFLLWILIFKHRVVSTRKYDIEQKNREKSIKMMGVYHKTTQSLEISLDIFSIDENYLDDDCESIPSLLCHDEYIEPQHIIYVNNI